MRFLKIRECTIRMRHLLFENAARQMEPRIRRKLLKSKRHEIDSHLEGAMVETKLGKRQVSGGIARVELDCFPEPFHCLRSLVISLGQLRCQQECSRIG